MDRRHFLHNSLALLAAGALPTWARGSESAPFQLLDVVPFVGEGRNHIETLSGDGLHARLAIDTSKLTQRRLITPRDQFFIRTGYPEHLNPNRPWSLTIDGLVEKPRRLEFSRLPSAEPLGTHLLECAGSTRNSSFGLMSAAQWGGIPIASLIDGWRPDPRATQVLVTGVDPLQGPNRGASWIFPIEDFQRGALGTHMNGHPLSKDHGFPLRFMMPGWYGCCWIKWVERIAFLDDDALATAHMQEYAGRTLQPGVPKRARDFAPARVDPAAMPVRLEQWKGPEGLFYRIVGIVWGGTRSPKGLVIRCSPETTVQKIEDFDPEDHRTWSLWSHVWRPKTAREYVFDLSFDEPGLQARRMRQGYYRRRARIDRVAI